MSFTSRRRALTAAALFVGSALLVSACATTPPPQASTGSPSPRETSTQTAPPEPSLPNESLPPTPSVEPSPSGSPSASPSASAKEVFELSGKGIGQYAFGTAEATVEKALQKRFGEPTGSFLGIQCEMDSKSPYISESDYGSLSVIYSAKDRSKKSARKLAAWGYNIEGGSQAGLSVAGNPPLDVDFVALHKKFPKGTLEETGYGEDAYVFTLPNKIRLLGEGSPNLVAGGRIFDCE
ncbi:MAG: hypothetical protein LBU38_05525 [Propionibacteriaceae bacterium]|nr:hypothetical protein [Propionibacteriaceae bacterium]